MSKIENQNVPMAATIAQVSAGTNDETFVTPKGLAGSIMGKKYMQQLISSGVMATGDSRWGFCIPSGFNGMKLVDVILWAGIAGTTNTATVQIRNATTSADMLTTRVSLDSGEKTSLTATTPFVIDTNNDDVTAGDLIAIDVDAVHTTPAQFWGIVLVFQLP